MIFHRRNLRAGILSTYSVLLFLSFALVGAAFNFAVNQYIRNSAVDQLNDSRTDLMEILQSMNNLNNADQLYPGEVSENDSRLNLFRTRLNAFIIDTEYRLADQQRMPADAQAIAEILRSENANLATMGNRRVGTADQMYYITAANTTLIFDGLPVYMLYYVDVTDLTRFAASVNMLLLSLVGGIWMVSVVMATFLASYIAQPIRQLGKFAERIGKGDFSPYNHSFREVEFENLSQCLNRAAWQLAQYDNEQKTFFQNVSHELRTPLMSIKCYAEGIQYALMDPQQASRTILAETDRLAGMVDDVLYMSAIDNITTKHVKETVDLRRIVAASAASQQTLAENKGLMFIFDMDETPVMVSCTSKHITRAVNNLISNAIRYAETTVCLSCRSYGASAKIAVADDGPGIDPEQLPHIFERFYKGNGGQQGIGLSIVKSVAEQHNGTVTVSTENEGNTINADGAKNISELNCSLQKGAVFTLTLPRG